MPRIKEWEYYFLKGLDSKWKWIARDGIDNRLYAYLIKPNKHSKHIDHWKDGGLFFKQIDENLFQSIQWEDEEPTNIQELIDEYESELFKNEKTIAADTDKITGNVNQFKVSDESEETEVNKDKEWLLDTFRNRQAFNNNFSKEYVLGKVKQLDEPETLSYEWIRENQERMDDHFYVKVNKLQNLLTPKPEKVKVPQDVADWLDDNIERYETVYSFIISIVEVFGNTVPEKVLSYARKNPDTMARAYLDGYEADEQKFYLIFPNIDNQGYKYTFIDTDGDLDAVDSKEHISDLGKTFTEQEIKELDPNYVHFAVKVDEVE